jgi:hypothetical protein
MFFLIRDIDNTIMTADAMYGTRLPGDIDPTSGFALYVERDSMLSRFWSPRSPVMAAALEGATARERATPTSLHWPVSALPAFPAVPFGRTW